MSKKFLIGQQNWRDCTENDFFEIKGYEGHYEINTSGVIHSLERTKKGRFNNIAKEKGCTKKNSLATIGYRHVNLYKDGKYKTLYVHRILAETFLPNPNNYKYINHLDGNKDNNLLDNLEWCTQQENIRHAFKINLIPCRKKVICLETGIVYDIATDAGRKLFGKATAQAGISACARGVRRIAYGYHWKFYEE